MMFEASRDTRTAVAGEGAAARLAAMNGGDHVPDGPLQVTTSSEANANLVRLVGELDLAGAPALSEAVARAAADGGSGRPLVLDMRDVSFIDSTGVRTLLEAAQSVGGSLALLAPSPAVTRVLDLTRLRGRFVEVAGLDDPALAG